MGQVVKRGVEIVNGLRRAGVEIDFSGAGVETHGVALRPVAAVCDGETIGGENASSLDKAIRAKDKIRVGDNSSCVTERNVDARGGIPAHRKINDTNSGA